jgi:glycosyltransferase involved in cell wall biosynthesis
MPEGLIEGRPFRPFSRAISSRSAAFSAARPATLPSASISRRRNSSVPIHWIVILSSWEVPQSPRFNLSHDHPTADRAALNCRCPASCPLLLFMRRVSRYIGCRLDCVGFLGALWSKPGRGFWGYRRIVGRPRRRQRRPAARETIVLKLLLIAPTCDGQDVGEAWHAYQWVRGLARRHDVTLLTYHKRGKVPASRQFSGLRVIEWAEPPLFGRAERLNSMLKPAYIPFYVKARRWIRRALARSEHFDIAHQPLPVAMRYPSPVAGLGIPYIIGPVGGSLDSPPGFQTEKDTAPWYVGLRAFDRMRMRLDPWLRATYDGADCVIGIAPYVGEFLESRSIRRFEIMSETAIEGLPEPVVRATDRGQVRLLYVGRLVRTKGVRESIRAMNQLRDLPVVLDIVGDGFDRAACETLAAEAGIADRVLFHGWQARDKVNDFYRAADIFVFPSYCEPGGNVAFEAMGYGLPLVVSDRGGPGNAVDETCGVRVHPVTPEQYAQDLAAAIRRLVENREVRLSLGKGARRRVADIGLWDRKLDKLDHLYAAVLEGLRESSR